MATCLCFPHTTARWAPASTFPVLKEPGPSAPPTSGGCVFSAGRGAEDMEKVKVAEFLFITLNHSTTIIGKLWLVLLLLVRAPVLLLAGYPLYADEQQRFVCNTVQPGCASVCFDAFSPLSLLRYCLLQLIAQCLAYALFLGYVVHEVTSQLAAFAEIKAEAVCGARRELPPAMGQRSNGAPLVGGATIRRYTVTYFLHLLLRIVFEAGFGAALYYLFGSHVPRRVLCDESPCTTTVDCYVSRPSEKTALLQFTLGISVFCLLLDVVDLVGVARRSAARLRRKRMLVRNMYEEECYMSAGGESLDPCLPLSLGVNEVPSAHQGEAEAFQYPEELRSRGLGGPDGGVNVGQLQAREDEEDMERAGSQVCLASPVGTPRPVVVCKRTRIRPPPPPRRDSSAKAFCTKRVGQYTLVELTAPDIKSDVPDVPDKRSAWV